MKTRISSSALYGLLALLSLPALSGELMFFCISAVPDGVREVVFFLAPPACALYGLVLLGLRGEEKWFRWAAVCNLLAAGLSLAVKLVIFTELLGAILLLILLEIVTILGRIFEFSAHENALFHVDAFISEHWQRLGRWRTVMASIVVGALVISPLFVLGYLAAIGLLAGLAINSVLAVPTLVRSAIAFGKHHL